MRLNLARLQRTLLLVLPAAAGLLVTPIMLSRRQAPAPSARAEAPRTAPDERAREAYGRIPLSFEANRGQTDGSVDFLARGAGYALFLRPAEAVLALRDSGARNEHPAESSLKTEAPHGEAVARPATRDPQSRVLRMRLVGADESAAAEGGDELAGKANYLVGDDPSRWLTDVPTYASVRYRGVYPGVDLIYYGNGRQLEYDFRVAPGGDPRVVGLRFDGADKVELESGGDLLLTLGESVIRQPKPFVYQEVAGARRAVEGGYAVGADGHVGFALGPYDKELPLVIDPILVYSTYLGGSASDQAWAVAADSEGNAYVAGFTLSTNFPTSNALQDANGGFQDAFVTKLNAAGTALVYSTYFGGGAQEQARGIAVDSSGNAYITGVTGSTNFPTLNPFQSAKGTTNEDAFVTKLNAAGTALVYSTYLGGGTSSEFGQAIAVDSSGNAYVTGVTFSTDFPTANAIQGATGGGSTDAFLTKINNTGGALVYSTYLGGNDSETGNGVAVDSSGNAYVTGRTASTNFPTANAIQGAKSGDEDMFVTKVSTTGTVFVYSTYLGGSALDIGEDIAADSSGNAYVAGQTFSTNFPVANAFQGANGGSSITQDATLTKISPTGGALVFSTYFGGLGGEIAFGVGLDSSGNIYIGGATGSTTTLPTADAIQCARGGGSDVFVAKFNPAATALIYSTYIGGSDDDEARGLAVDPTGNAYLAGNTFSTDYPTANPVQATFAGGAGLAGDAFVTKVSSTAAGPASQLQFTQTTPVVQEDMTFVTLTVQRTGDTSAAVTVDYATANVSASERSDYTTAVGTLRFAAGDTSESFDLLVNEDSFAEGNESFIVTLSNPTGGATLSCATAVATVQITDDSSEPSTNVIDDPTVFVGQHYHDFLNRQADPAGLSFWAGQITACGSDAACIDRTRTNVSAAFFLSIEFQQTGYLVFRFYKASFTDSAARPRGMPRYREFLRDTREIGRGVVVNQGDWQTQLESNKQEFARRWVQRPEFLAQFPESMSAGAFVDKLFQNSEVTPTQAERDAAIAAYGAGGVEGRAAALRSVADSGSVYNRQFNAGFVLSQYIGYLRRNPNDAPEPGLNYAGYDFWLAKLDSFSQPGEDVRNEQTALARVNRAEMVRAFIVSAEYRGRFGQP